MGGAGVGWCEGGPAGQAGRRGASGRLGRGAGSAGLMELTLVSDTQQEIT